MKDSGSSPPRSCIEASEPAKVAVVIPTFNRKRFLERMIEQLKGQEAANTEIVIIAVVDGSTDGTFEMLERRFPDVHVVKGDGSWWYTRSMNEGFRCAEKMNVDFVLTLNDDVEIEERYVQALLNASRKAGKDSIIGSISFTLNRPHRITFSGVKEIRWWRYKELNYHKAFEEADPNKLSGTVPSVLLPGRGILIPWGVLKALNYFDEDFVQYGSDDDFCLRAHKRGFTVYVCWDARVFSRSEMTGKGTPFLRQTIVQFLGSFFNRYSRNYLIKSIKMIYRHGHRVLLPLTTLIVIIGTLKAYFFKYRAMRRAAPVLNILI